MNEFKLTYFLDGEPLHSVTLAAGEKILPEDAPEKEGYTFCGWEDLPEEMPEEDLEVTAVYTVNSYNLIYKVDGEEVLVVPCAYGEVPTCEEEPVKEGHTFSGWTENFPETMPACDVVLEGAFTVNEYRLIFAVEGSMSFPKTVPFGTPISLITEPIRPHHTFSGWSEIPETMPAQDVLVTGSFKIDSFPLTLTLDGEVIFEEEVDYGTDLSFIEIPEKEGHTFSGWQDLPETMPDHPVAATGHFSVNYYSLVYEVAGEMTFPRSVAYGTPLKPLSAPTREHYTFSGWSEIPASMPAQDVTVRGFFSINVHMLEYFLDGELLWDAPVAYSDPIPALAAPEKEGYTFSGWSETPETMPDEPVKVSGKFSVNYYKLTYLLNGEVYYEEDVAYGDVVKLLADPEKRGHTFSGWSEIPMLMPAGDVTIEGALTPNTYELVLRVDGEEIAREGVVYGTELPVLPEQEKIGHTFSGWSEVPEVMPDEEVVAEGNFTVNYYTLSFSINDGEVMVPDTVAYGTPIFPIEAPVREFYEFSGWSEMPETMPAEDLTVVGTLRAVCFPVTYEVDGEAFATDMVPYETTVVPPADMQKDGYTFSGWEDVPAAMPASPITVRGSYTPNPYVLTYAVEGEVDLSETILCGTPLDRLFVPEKEGYVFSGWKDVPAVMPAGDLVLKGEFTEA